MAMLKDLLVSGSSTLVGDLNVNSININGNITPQVNNSYDMGNENYRWNNVYANNFVGTASAATAAAGTQSVNVIPYLGVNGNITSSNIFYNGVALYPNGSRINLGLSTDESMQKNTKWNNFYLSNSIVFDYGGVVGTLSKLYYDYQATSPDVLDDLGAFKIQTIDFDDSIKSYTYSFYAGGTFESNSIYTNSIEVNGNILPDGSSHNLGSSSYRWNNVYASEFNGTATKATAANLLTSGGLAYYLNGDGTFGEIENVAYADNTFYPSGSVNFGDSSNHFDQYYGNYGTFYNDVSVVENIYANNITITNNVAANYIDINYAISANNIIANTIYGDNTIRYAVCSTGASANIKTINLNNFTLVNGSTIIIKFTNTSTAKSPQIQINGNETYTKNIYFSDRTQFNSNSSYISQSILNNNYYYTFVYDSTLENNNGAFVLTNPTSFLPVYGGRLKTLTDGIDFNNGFGGYGTMFHLIAPTTTSNIIKGTSGIHILQMNWDTGTKSDYDVQFAVSVGASTTDGISLANNTRAFFRSKLSSKPWQEIAHFNPGVNQNTGIGSNAIPTYVAPGGILTEVTDITTNVVTANDIAVSNNITVTKNVTANHIIGNYVHGGVWNDYAEYRSIDVTQPGRVVKENGDGNLSLTTSRLERGCEIITDTYGFAVGQTEINSVPIAAAGRVLAYPDADPSTFEIGAPVCSGPNGTVSMMTAEEEQKYPSRIMGTVSEIPTYEIWHGQKDIEVNGRIWIRIR